MTVYLSTVFSPNMFPNRYKTITVFTRVSEKVFFREIKDVYERGELVNIINHRDTVRFINKMTGLELRPSFQEIALTEDDKMLLLTIKDKHKHNSVKEAYDKGYMRFYIVEVM